MGYLEDHRIDGKDIECCWIEVAIASLGPLILAL